MLETIDKAIVRLIYIILMFSMIYLYRFAHSFFYPSIGNQLLKRIFPSKNSVSSLHFFSHIVGLGIMYSGFQIFLGQGLLLGILDFIVLTLVAFTSYLASLYIMNSIVLYNFEYNDEVIKRQNYSYSIISSTHALTVAFIIKTVLIKSEHSVVLFIFLWLLSMVLLGLSSKFFENIFKLGLNKLIVQKNLAVAFTFMGMTLGNGLIISTCLSSQLVDLKSYALEFTIKLVLSFIMTPLIRSGLILIFKLQEDFQTEQKDNHAIVPETGYGIFQGCLYFTTCLITTVIIGDISYESLFPTY